MRTKVMVMAIAAACAVPVGAMAAGDPPSASRRTAPAADPRSSSRPAPARPRNPVDRSITDPGAATFKSFDANKDGYVSRGEAKESSELSRRFNELDADRDGKLSLRELTGWRNRAYAVPAPPALK